MFSQLTRIIKYFNPNPTKSSLKRITTKSPENRIKLILHKYSFLKAKKNAFKIWKIFFCVSFVVSNFALKVVKFYWVMDLFQRFARFFCHLEIKIKLSTTEWISVLFCENNMPTKTLFFWFVFKRSIIWSILR